MNRVLLVSAASLAVILATPASAEHWSDRGFPAAASVNVHRGGGAFAIDGRFGRHHRDRHDRRDRDRRGRRDFDRGDFFGPWDYSYDFDGNRSFDPDKWNDWWHDRPDRAYPRWMSRNRDCARPWYSGDVLTC